MDGRLAGGVVFFQLLDGENELILDAGLRHDVPGHFPLACQTYPLGRSISSAASASGSLMTLPSLSLRRCTEGAAAMSSGAERAVGLWEIDGGY